MPKIIWICHAIPAATGIQCGHINTVSALFRGLVVCSECGCTKIASDARGIEERRVYPLQRKGNFTDGGFF